MMECITEYNEAETFNLLKAECEARGEAKGGIKKLVSLTKKGLLSEDVAAKEAEMSLDEFKRCEELYCS